jgi:hypothetical protein
VTEAVLVGGGIACGSHPDNFFSVVEAGFDRRRAQLGRARYRVSPTTMLPLFMQSAFDRWPHCV